jgi:hypothetical protein
MKLPDDPYSSFKSTDKVKLQAYVAQADKDLLMTVLPDRNLYTLLLTHALKRAADLIRNNNLEYSNVADQQRLLNFILTGIDDGLRKPTPARAPRKAAARDDARTGS